MAARSIRMTTSPVRSSRWKTRSPNIPSSTPSRRRAASPNSCPTPSGTSRRNTRTRWPRGALALVVADTLPVQIDLLKEGLASGNVGQRPFEMGYRAMYFLKDIKDGKPAPKDPTYTGLDVCTPKTATTCIGGGA